MYKITNTQSFLSKVTKPKEEHLTLKEKLSAPKDLRRNFEFKSKIFPKVSSSMTYELVLVDISKSYSN